MLWSAAVRFEINVALCNVCASKYSRIHTHISEACSHEYMQAVDVCACMKEKRREREIAHSNIPHSLCPDAAFFCLFWFNSGTWNMENELNEHRILCRSNARIPSQIRLTSGWTDAIHTHKQSYWIYLIGMLRCLFTYIYIEMVWCIDIDTHSWLWVSVFVTRFSLCNPQAVSISVCVRELVVSLFFFITCSFGCDCVVLHDIEKKISIVGAPCVLGEWAGAVSRYWVLLIIIFGRHFLAQIY